MTSRLRAFPRWHLAGLALVLPYLVGFAPAPADSSWTDLAVALGAGSYAEVSRDCQGNVINAYDVPFNEKAVAIHHYTPEVHFGFSAGTLSEQMGEKLFEVYPQWEFRDGEIQRTGRGVTGYVSPVVGVNLRSFGFDAGYVAPLTHGFRHLQSGLPAVGLRIGATDGLHLRARYANDLPLITGGPGLVSVGVGFRVSRPWNSLWLGVGGGMYDGTLFGLQGDVQIIDRLSVQMSGAIGGGQRLESGYSLGMRWKL